MFFRGAMSQTLSVELTPGGETLLAHVGLVVLAAGALVLLIAVADLEEEEEEKEQRRVFGEHHRAVSTAAAPRSSLKISRPPYFL